LRVKLYIVVDGEVTEIKDVPVAAEEEITEEIALEETVVEEEVVYRDTCHRRDGYRSCC
jgi:hypothetical protein